MARNYIVQGKGITVANQATTTLVAINPASGRAFKVIRCWASQTSSTTSGQQGIELGFKASAFSTLVSATPEKTWPSDPVSYITGGTAGAAGTSGINASAEGAGTFTTKYPDTFNILSGWLWTPNSSLQEEFLLSSADSLAFAMRFTTTPTTLTGWNFGVEFQEVG